MGATRSTSAVARAVAASALVILPGCGGDGGDATPRTIGDASVPVDEGDEPSRVDRLRGLPYAGSSEVDEGAARGVVLVDEERSWPGVNLVTIQMLSRAELIDASGALLRSWRMPDSDRWERVELLENGDLLAIGADPAPQGTRGIPDGSRYLARFDWDGYAEVVKVFTRMLDNVVEINGLPLPQQRNEITRKRRHGMGFLGLGSTITMLGMKYGDGDSIEFTEKISREMALAGWEAGLELAKEKGPAPIMNEDFEVTAEMLRKRPEMANDGYQVGDKVPGRLLHARYSRYMQRVAEVAPELAKELEETGARFTHHTSIAPTGTISLSLANNASNGIEPSFAHHYFRNVIREGKKSKEKVDVFSFELLAYRALVNEKAMPFSENEDEALPDYFITADDISPTQHVDIQAAAQRWIDSSISKTANVPTDYPYEDFKDIYLYAYENGLKGCTTFRFNPEAFQGVLVKEDDLKNTTYVFELEDGNTVEVAGDEEIEYDGETHTAANLFDALKEGYYGKF